VNLTKRTKWLIGGAAVVAAYIAFGPKDSDSVEPARAGAAASVHATHAASATAAQTAPIARTLLALAHRVVDASASSSLFASHSWYVAPPPPPPPPPVVAAPVVPVKPVAPPLPFLYMGSYAPNGTKPVYFLTEGDRVYDVHVGDTLNNTYTVDSVTNGALVFTYKPLNQQQQLSIGGAP
jgi:hypothetical protein